MKISFKEGETEERTRTRIRGRRWWKWNMTGVEDYVKESVKLNVMITSSSSLLYLKIITLQSRLLFDDMVFKESLKILIR
jgi:hypothetical protein